MANVRALLVGIDAYVAVTPLSGCVADIDAIEAMLRKHVQPDQLSLVALRNEQATRSNIIETFRSHLGPAESDEIALFYFAGHGSQEPCPEEWARLEPDGLNETIVCVDSRTPGVWDLADKEINALIEEAGARGAQVVMIFDSCHSGGVTRDILDVIPPSVRAAPTAQERRVFSNYLDVAQTRYDPSKLADGSPPDPAHIALSACQPHQTAKELPMLGTHRGAFSYAFEESVSLIGESASYVELAAAIRAKLHSQVNDQAPDLYAGGGASSATTFLAGTAKPRLLTANSDGGDWWLSAGAVDGITPPASATTEIELSGHGASPTGDATVLADAQVVEVEPSRAKLRVVARPQQTLDPTNQYLAVITKFAAPALRLVITGTGATEVAAGLTGVSPLVVVTTEVPTEPSGIRTLTVDIAGQDVSIQGTAGSPIASTVPQLAADIAHLARWHALLDRVAPGSRVSSKVSIEVLELSRDQAAATDMQAPVNAVNGAIALSYDGAKPPRVQLRVTNAHDRRLFAALFDLTDSYGSVKLFADWAEPGKPAWARQGQVQTLTIPDWSPTATEANDRLKLIVSTVEFDADAWVLPRLLGAPEDHARGQGRDVEGEDPQDPVADDTWGTSLLTIVTTRQPA